MTCPRCQGFMATLTLNDPESTVPSEPVRAWRCVCCGEILDATIAANRASAQALHGSRRAHTFGVRLDGSGPDQHPALPRTPRH